MKAFIAVKSRYYSCDHENIILHMYIPKVLIFTYSIHLFLFSSLTKSSSLQFPRMEAMSRVMDEGVWEHLK